MLCIHAFQKAAQRNGKKGKTGKGKEKVDAVKRWLAFEKKERKEEEKKKEEQR